MMALVDFKTVSGELDSADYMRVMRALVRSSLLHGSDNRPAVVILTDKALYYGGTEDLGRRFHRVSLKSVSKASMTGRLLWECVELTHMGLSGEETVYICPFTGSLNAPRKDAGSLNVLLEALSR